ncbi:hypothetical protein AN218_19890 [Streptomyces nanshensis]|uniref:Uncharacterized protein n=1 Tax=Streptomyces nanshensis TaxID=518642 RepID=A0A1E7L177_9ACTN|nr:hypothetical protein AN218_19890 [Streptomyces nanshensis]
MQGGGTVVDGKTGRVISQGRPGGDGPGGDGQDGFVPAGQRLRQRIARTRGGRVALGAGRVAWHSTVGFPALVNRLPAKRSEYGARLDRHLAHYEKKISAWEHDSREGRQHIEEMTSEPLRRSYETVTRPFLSAEAMRQRSESGAPVSRAWTRFEPDEYEPPPRPADTGGPPPSHWGDRIDPESWPEGAWSGPRRERREASPEPTWDGGMSPSEAWGVRTRQEPGGIIVDSITGEVLSDPYGGGDGRAGWADPPPPDDAPPPPPDDGGRW